VELPIEMAADDVAAFRGEVAIIQEAQREKLFVTAEPEPAQARLIAPTDGKIDFGTVEKGKSGEARVTIANDGGQELVLNPTELPPFSLDKSRPLRIAAGGQAEFAIKFETDQGGKYTKNLILSGNGGAISLALSGTLNDPRRSAMDRTGAENPHLDKRSPTRSGTGRATSFAKPDEPEPEITVPPSLSKGPSKLQEAPVASLTPAEPEPEGDGKRPKTMMDLPPKARLAAGLNAHFGIGMSEMPEFKSSTLEPVEQIERWDVGQNHLVLAWKNPTVEPARYQVEAPMTIKAPGTSIPVKTWKPLKEWEETSAPAGKSAARIPGLSPGEWYEFRVVGVDSEGKVSPPSDIIQVSTLPPYRAPYWVWVLSAALLGLAVLLVYRQRMVAVR
jgi:hypothetical protein